MSNVIKLEGKYVEKRIRKKGKVKYYTCNSCNTKYHEDLMISYLPTNYGYYQDDSTHYCIKCYNLKF